MVLSISVLHHVITHSVAPDRRLQCCEHIDEHCTFRPCNWNSTTKQCLCYMICSDESIPIRGVNTALLPTYRKAPFRRQTSHAITLTGMLSPTLIRYGAAAAAGAACSRGRGTHLSAVALPAGASRYDSICLMTASYVK